MQELIRTLPMVERKIVLDMLAKPEIQRAAGVLGEHLRRVDPRVHPFQQAVFQDKKISYIALSALQQQKITSSQFVTIQAYKAQEKTLKAIANRRPVYVSLTAPYASEWIQQTNKIKGVVPILTGRSELCYLQKAQMDEMIGLVQERAPVSERGFFLYPDIVRPGSMTEALSRIGYDILIRAPGSFRMLPSHSLMEAFFEVRFSGKQMQPLPTIGVTCTEEMRQKEWEGKRVCHVPFEKYQGVLADGKTTEGDEFYKHDLYHIYVASCGGIKVVHALLKMANFIYKYRMQGVHNTSVMNGLEELEIYLIDMEFPRFRPELRSKEEGWNGKESEEVVFWYSLSEKIQLAFANRGKEEAICTLEKKGFFRGILREVLFNPEWNQKGFTKRGLTTVLKRVEFLKTSPIRTPQAQMENSYFIHNLHPLQCLQREWLKVLSEVGGADHGVRE